MLTEDAVKFFKGKTRLAKALSISPAAVSQWGKHVPRLRQFELHAISAGRLKVAHHVETKQLAA
jgi:DNA-binding transcriptional regulator YdaS (Cro superfamily)